MKRIYLLLVLFALSMSVSAQKYFYEKEREEYKQATPEVKAKMDSFYITRENYFREEQVKSICGIDFGSTYEVTRRKSQKKFGTPTFYSNETTLVYDYITYGGVNFSKLIFLFQSDGERTYFYRCIFAKNVKTLDEAKDLIKEYAEGILKRYNLISVNKEDESPLYIGGVSPLWNGRWYRLTMEDITAVRVDVIEQNSSSEEKTEYPYAVRIVYGPFNYVKEEF